MPPDDQLIIVYAFAIYAVYVLLPIIPTVVIYRLFPDTQVNVGGPFKGLTVRATGAFAAYIVCVLLGRTFALDIYTYITTDRPWSLEAPVTLLDSDGKQIKDHTLLDDLMRKIEVSQSNPDLVDIPDDQHVIVTFPRYRDSLPKLSFAVDGWFSQSIPVNLAHKKQGRDYFVDNSDPHKLVLQEPITISQPSNPYPADAAPEGGINSPYPSGSHPH